MPGSGVSMVADVLGASGVRLVTDGALAEVTEALLAATGGAWDLPPDLPEGWDLLSAPAAVRVQAAKVLRELDLAEPWAWCATGAALTLPFWRRLVPGLKLVLCVRDPRAAVASLRRKRGISVALGARLWTVYNERATADPGGAWRVVTHYESHLFDARSEAERLVRALGLEATGEALEAAARIPTAKRRRRAASAPLDGPLAELAPRYLQLCADGGPQLHVAIEEELEALSRDHELAELRRAVAAAEAHADELAQHLEEAVRRSTRRITALQRGRARAREADAEREAQHQQELARLRTELAKARAETKAVIKRRDALRAELDQVQAKPGRAPVPGRSPGPARPPAQRSAPVATAPSNGPTTGGDDAESRTAAAARATWRSLPAPAQKLLRPAAERARRRVG